MGKLTKEEIEAIYPTAKSPETIRRELQMRQLAKQPKAVYFKTSLAVALVVVILLIANRLISLAISSDSSMGAVLTGTSLSMLMGLVTLGLIWYLHNYVYSFIYKTAISMALVKAVAIVVIVMAFGSYLAAIKYQQGLILSIVLSDVFSFIVMYLCMRFILANIKVN